MELATELLVSAFIAIALSFLIAKLVSAILAPDGEAEKRIVMEEMRLRSARGGESGSRVEAVRGEVKEVDRFEGQAPVNDSVEVGGGFHGESEAVDLSVEQTSSLEVLSSAVLEREVELVKELNVSSGLVGEEEEEGVEKRVDDECDDQEIEVQSVAREFAVVERGEIGSSGCEEENQKGGGGGNEEIGVLGIEEENQQNGGNDEMGVVGCEEEDQKRGGSEEIGVVRCEEEDQKSGGSEEIGVVRCEDENEKSGGSAEIGVVRCEDENEKSGGSAEIGVVRCEDENEKSGGSAEIGVVRCEDENEKSGGSAEIGVVRCEDGSEKSGRSEEIGVVRCEDESEKSGRSEDIGVVRCEEGLDEGRHGVEEEVRVDGDDDDWEGIERSELEKVFAAAANYVTSGDHGDELGGVGSDVEMELYGFHKVATEGPCRESQPMALRVSARAYWNAWQKLGNMNPDVAMERYVALLSEKIPGWTKDNYAGDSKRDVFQEGTTSTQDPKSSTFPCHEPNLTDERKPEMNPAVEGDHLAETSHVVEKVIE